MHHVFHNFVTILKELVGGWSKAVKKVHIKVGQKLLISEIYLYKGLFTTNRVIYE